MGPWFAFSRRRANGRKGARIIKDDFVFEGKKMSEDVTEITGTCVKNSGRVKLQGWEGLIG